MVDTFASKMYDGGDPVIIADASSLMGLCVPMRLPHTPQSSMMTP